MDKFVSFLLVALGCVLMIVSVSGAVDAPAPGEVSVSVTNMTVSKISARVQGATVVPADSRGGWVFPVNPGNSIAIRLVGVSDGGGDPTVSVDGAMNVSKEICRNKSKRRRVTGTVAGANPTDCECTGLTPSSGDKLVIKVTGTAAGAAT